MNATPAKLLRAAAEIVGGKAALAERLGTTKSLVAKFIDGSWKVPDRMLLRAVDILLEDREKGRDEAASPARSTSAFEHFVTRL